MTTGPTSGIDAFMAARAAASRRLDAAPAVARANTRTLTGNAAASDNVAAAQPSPKAPAKGQYIDVLA